MAPDLRRAETAGLARFTPLSKRLQMTNWVGCSTNRDVVPQSCTPTMDEQRRLWDWHLQHWRGRGGLKTPVLPRGPQNGRAHPWTPSTVKNRISASSFKKKKKQQDSKI